MTNIILLHGALGSAETMQAAKNKLSDESNLFTADFPGHGKNSNKDFGINEFTDFLEGFIEDNKLETYSIFGYSMGGYVALNLASRNPSGLEKIITLGTKFDWTPETAAGEVKKLNPNVIEEKVPKFAQYLESLHEDWKGLMNKTAGMMLQMGEERGLSSDLLAKVNVPVKLYRGSEDSMVTSEETEKVANQLKNGVFEELWGIQHPIDRIDPEVIADLIRKERT